MARERIRSYLQAVGQEIRWPRARNALLRELSDHIADQEADLLSQNLPPEEAERRAVAEMGDPVSVGRALDRLHRPQNRWEIVLFLATAALAGLVLHGFTHSRLYNGPEQFIGISLGLAGMVCLWLCDYPRLLRRLRPVLPLIFLLLPLLFSLTLLSDGSPRRAARWFLYLYLFYPLLFAAWLGGLRKRGPAALACSHLVILAGALPSMLFPSMELCLILTCTMLLVLTSAVRQGTFTLGRRAGLLAVWLPPAALSSMLLLRHAAFLSQRLQVFLFPDRDPAGRGYQYSVLRSMAARLSLFQGDAAGYQDTALYHSADLMLSNLASALGSAVLWVSLLGILLFAFLCIRRIRALHSSTGRLLAWAALSPLLLQGGFYWLSNLGYGLFTGLPFPFLSYAPMGQVFSFLLAGVLLSVFRMDPLARDSKLLGGPSAQLFRCGTLSLPHGTLRIEYQPKQAAK